MLAEMVDVRPSSSTPYLSHDEDPGGEAGLDAGCHLMSPLLDGVPQGRGSP